MSKSKPIRIHQDTYNALVKLATGFETPNDVIKRLLETHYVYRQEIKSENKD